MPESKEGGGNHEMAGGNKGAFERVVVSVRVHGGVRVGAKEDRFQFGVLRKSAY